MFNPTGHEADALLGEECPAELQPDSHITEPVCSQWQHLIEGAICLFLIAVAVLALHYSGRPSSGDLHAGLNQLKQDLVSLKQ